MSRVRCLVFLGAALVVVPGCGLSPSKEHAVGAPEARGEASCTIRQGGSAGRSDFGPTRGDWEVFAAGIAQNDRRFDHGSAALVIHAGRYVDEEILISVQRTVLFTDQDVDTSVLDAAIAAVVVPEWHRRLRPFLGMRLGFVRGESVNESPLVGVHGGAKAFLQPKSFVQVVAGYDSFFTKTEDTTERLHRGQWTYAVGIGVCF